MISALLGTTNGGYLFVKKNGRWSLRHSFLRGQSVSHFARVPGSGTIYATTLTDGVFKSTDGGKKWVRLSRGLHIKKTWTVAIHPADPRVVLCGTHYGHIFRSEDGGRSWKDMEGFYKAPGREEAGVDWGFGTIGHCIHTILFEPEKPERLFVVSSSGGPYRSDDEGQTWHRIREGMLSECPDAPAEQMEEHVKFVHGCTHRIAMAKRPGGITLFQQNHCGVYRSDDLGDHWKDVSKGLPSRHGFPIATLGGKWPTVFVIPAYQDGKCEQHNSCIKGPLEVWRSEDSGKSWRNVSRGLPRKVHSCVLRHAMSAAGDRVLLFGTTTGGLYCTEDAGESWQSVATGLGRIQGVVAVEV
jgi:photosystem II stability/assembly factor-like uncharacterized protein